MALPFRTPEPPRHAALGTAPYKCRRKAISGKLPKGTSPLETSLPTAPPSPPPGPVGPRAQCAGVPER